MSSSSSTGVSSPLSLSPSLTWSAGYVAFSFFLSLVGVFTSLQLFQQRTGGSGLRNWLLLVLVSICFGVSGHWSGLLVFSLAVSPLDFSLHSHYLSPFLLALALTLTASLLSFWLLQHERYRTLWVLCSSLLLGFVSTISSVLSIEALAMPVAAQLVWDIPILVGACLFACSLLGLVLFVFCWYFSQLKYVQQVHLLCSLVAAGALVAHHRIVYEAAQWRIGDPSNTTFLFSSTLEFSSSAMLACAVSISSLSLLTFLLDRLRYISVQLSETKKSRSLLLSALFYDDRDRILTTTLGTLPSVVLADSYVGQGSFDSLNPDFRNMLRTAFDWSKAADDQLLKLIQSRKRDYSLELYLKFIKAASTLARAFDLDLRDLGIMYPAPISLEGNYQGIMATVIKQVTPTEAEAFSALGGYKWTPREVIEPIIYRAYGRAEGDLEFSQFPSSGPHAASSPRKGTGADQYQLVSAPVSTHYSIGFHYELSSDSSHNRDGDSDEDENRRGSMALFEKSTNAGHRKGKSVNYSQINPRASFASPSMKSGLAPLTAHPESPSHSAASKLPAFNSSVPSIPPPMPNAANAFQVVAGHWLRSLIDFDRSCNRSLAPGVYLGLFFVKVRGSRLEIMVPKSSLHSVPLVPIFNRIESSIYFSGCAQQSRNHFSKVASLESHATRSSLVAPKSRVAAPIRSEVRDLEWQWVKSLVSSAAAASAAQIEKSVHRLKKNSIVSPSDNGFQRGSDFNPVANLSDHAAAILRGPVSDKRRLQVVIKMLKRRYQSLAGRSAAIPQPLSDPDSTSDQKSLNGTDESGFKPPRKRDQSIDVSRLQGRNGDAPANATISEGANLPPIFIPTSDAEGAITAPALISPSNRTGAGSGRVRRKVSHLIGSVSSDGLSDPASVYDQLTDEDYLLQFQHDFFRASRCLKRRLGSDTELMPKNLFDQVIICNKEGDVHLILFVHSSMQAKFPTNYREDKVMFCPLDVFESAHRFQFHNDIKIAERIAQRKREEEEKIKKQKLEEEMAARAATNKKKLASRMWGRLIRNAKDHKAEIAAAFEAEAKAEAEAEATKAKAMKKRKQSRATLESAVAVMQPAGDAEKSIDMSSLRPEDAQHNSINFESLRDDQLKLASLDPKQFRGQHRTHATGSRRSSAVRFPLADLQADPSTRVVSDSLNSDKESDGSGNSSMPRPSSHTMTDHIHSPSQGQPRSQSPSQPARRTGRQIWRILADHIMSGKLALVDLEMQLDNFGASEVIKNQSGIGKSGSSSPAPSSPNKGSKGGNFLSPNAAAALDAPGNEFLSFRELAKRRASLAERAKEAAASVNKGSPRWIKDVIESILAKNRQSRQSSQHARLTLEELKSVIQTDQNLCKTQWRHLRKHRNCFTGESLISWLIENEHALERTGAALLANQLFRLGMVAIDAEAVNAASQALEFDHLEQQIADDETLYTFKDRPAQPQRMLKGKGSSGASASPALKPAAAPDAPAEIRLNISSDGAAGGTPQTRKNRFFSLDRTPSMKPNKSPQVAPAPHQPSSPAPAAPAFSSSTIAAGAASPLTPVRELRLDVDSSPPSNQRTVAPLDLASPTSGISPNLLTAALLASPNSADLISSFKSPGGSDSADKFGGASDAPHLSLADLKHQMLSDSSLIRDRAFMFKSYPRSVLGQELVSWLVEKGHAADRSSATMIGKALMVQGLRLAQFAPPAEAQFEDDSRHYTFDAAVPIVHTRRGSASSLFADQPHSGAIRDQRRNSQTGESGGLAHGNPTSEDSKFDESGTGNEKSQRSLQRKPSIVHGLVNYLSNKLHGERDQSAGSSEHVSSLWNRRKGHRLSNKDDSSSNAGGSEADDKAKLSERESVTPLKGKLKRGQSSAMLFDDSSNRAPGSSKPKGQLFSQNSQSSIDRTINEFLLNESATPGQQPLAPPEGRAAAQLELMHTAAAISASVESPQLGPRESRIRSIFTLKRTPSRLATSVHRNSLPDIKSLDEYAQ